LLLCVLEKNKCLKNILAKKNKKNVELSAISPTWEKEEDRCQYSQDHLLGDGGKFSLSGTTQNKRRQPPLLSSFYQSHVRHPLFMIDKRGSNADPGSSAGMDFRGSSCCWMAHLKGDKNVRF
jgi:hypothetical protein